MGIIRIRSLLPIIPGRRMHDWNPHVAQSRDPWPRNVVQCPSCADYHLCFILNRLSVFDVVYSDVPEHIEQAFRTAGCPPTISMSLQPTEHR
jgi:hypothetical protein